MNRKTKVLLSCTFIVFANAFVPASAFATTFNLPNGSSAELQKACSQTKPGDEINIPAGDFTFASRVQCPAGITLRGAGAQQTILRSTSVTEEMIDVDGSNGKPFVATGLKFIGRGTNGAFLDLAIKLRSSPKDFRVHHCAFENFGGYGIAVIGNARGVVDHSTFKKIYYGSADSMGYGVCVYGDSFTSWMRPLDLGSAEAVFVEDNTFNDVRHAVASNDGSRYVFRHNTVTDPPSNFVPIDAHGFELGSPTGSRSFEVYDNIVSRTSGSSWTGSIFRGGDGVIFNNTFGPGMSITIYLVNAYAESSGCSYPCTNQTRELYAWNNTNNGSPAVVTIRAGHEVYFKLGRDYFLNARPNYTPYVYPHPLTQDTSPTTVKFENTSLPNAMVGLNYDFSFGATGGTTPYTYQVTSGSLPQGLQLSAAGRLSGTPTMVQSASFSVAVKDANSASVAQSFTLVVNPQGVIVDADGGTAAQDAGTSQQTKSPPIDDRVRGVSGRQLTGGCSSGTFGFAEWLAFLAIAVLVSRRRS